MNITSETTALKLTCQGGHTGFLDCVDLMRRHPDLQVLVNSNERCDVLHSHSWGPGYLLQGVRYSGRRILTAHATPESAEGSLPFMNAGTRILIRRYLTRVFNYSDVVVAVAPETANSIRQLGVTSTIETIPNAIRTDRFFPSATLRREGRFLLGLEPDDMVVLGVGQLQPRKGIQDFVEAARALPHVQFVWAGGRPFGLVSAGLRELARLAEAAPPNMKFAGMFDLERMPVIYNAADILLFPSFQELCPYATVEAAACGLPVVYRRLPQYDALYRRPYLSAVDAPGFVAVLSELLSSPLRLRRAREISREIAGMFGMDAFVNALAQVYHDVACGRVAPREVA
ncbi:MAG: glycosyltransferase family 4 protein [Gemmatimonadales bacterium]